MSGTRKADIIRDLAAQLKQSEETKEGILRMLALKDVKIDAIDEMIVNIDRAIPPLLAQINDLVPPIKKAFDDRITAGCRSELTWETTESGEDEDGNPVTTYQVVKNDTGSFTPKTGQKYYRKPLNRDYGANIITEVVGNITDESYVGISTLIVLSGAGVTGIKLGDIITDNLDDPDLFQPGNLPRVTAIGTTDFVGFTTEIQGNIAVGDNEFAVVGIGTTLAVQVGSAVSLTGAIPFGTKVTGFGQKTTNVPLYNPTTKSFSTVARKFPSIVLDANSTSTITLGLMQAGEETNQPTLTLDRQPAQVAISTTFVVIRDTADIADDFDYTKSPIDPVTIGILGSQLGIGHRTVIDESGADPGPKQWREVLEDPEPAVGAGRASYMVGNNQWPISNSTGDIGGGISYVTLGETLVSETTTLDDETEAITTNATFTSTPPPGSDDATACAARQTDITNKINAHAAMKSANMAEINRLNSLSQALRSYRDEEELQAWGMLQGAAYEEQRAKKSEVTSADFDATDLSAFDP